MTVRPSSPSLWSLLVWVLLASMGVLLSAELARVAPCWGIVIMVLILAYPLWRSLQESFLFDRRIILTGATRAHCAARHWLWNGRIGSVLRVPLALGMAVLLLAMMLRLGTHQWAILMADALVFVLLYHVFQRRIASQINPHMLGVFVRGRPLRWTNLGLLTLAFFALSFFLLGAADLRQAHWQTVAERAFEDGRQALVCPWMGWLVGGLDALEQGSWALAQRHIPGLALPEWRLAAWLLVLLQFGLLALLYTRLLLGVITLVESRGVRAESLTGHTTLAKTFVVTILVLVLLSLYPVLRWRDLDPSQFATPAQDVLTWIDPCRATIGQNAETQAALDTELAAQRARLTEETAERIDQEVERLFAPMDAAVDAYLDWYFTLIGEYTRLAALVVGDFPRLMAEQLDTHLFVATEFQTREEALEQHLREATLTQMSGLSQTLEERIEAQANTHPCTRASLDWTPLQRLDRDLWRAGAAGTSGAVAGVATVALSQKVVAAVIAKVGAKKSVQAAAVMGAKLVAKKSGGALAAALGGAAVCAPTGPWAIVCGVGAGVVTWLAVDTVAIEIDEAVSREAMRAEILEVLAEEQEALKAALRERHAALIGQLTEEIRTTVDGVFIPARDGL